MVHLKICVLASLPFAKCISSSATPADDKKARGNSKHKFLIKTKFTTFKKIINQQICSHFDQIVFNFEKFKIVIYNLDDDNDLTMGGAVMTSKDFKSTILPKQIQPKSTHFKCFNFFWASSFYFDQIFNIFENYLNSVEEFSQPANKTDNKKGHGTEDNSDKKSTCFGCFGKSSDKEIEVCHKTSKDKR